MTMDKRVQAVLDRALSGKAPTRQECTAFLACPPESMEAAMTRVAADQLSRRRFANTGYLSGQVGVEVAPCPANCGFCAFGEKFTHFTAQQLSDEEILSRVHGFVDPGDLHTLFLMTMHHFNFKRLLHIIELARGISPPTTEIVVNIGDFDLVQARELKAAGAGGAYHVCRLREGIDTRLDPVKRKKTLRTIHQAGLNLHYCCEPIGPEHSPEELVEQMFLGIENGCYCHAAMRRVPVPGTPLYHLGQITELRLAQVVAVVALATLECDRTIGIGVHEPNILSLTSGATSLCAKTGANPRDTAEDTSRSRGLSVENCRQMLREANFTAVLGFDGTRIPLAMDQAKKDGKETKMSKQAKKSKPVKKTQKTDMGWTIDGEKMAAAADKYFMVDERCCGESVLKAGCDAMGIKCDLVPDIALGFGGGVGLQGHVCGAVSGAVLAVSVAMLKKTPDYGARKMATFEAAGRVCEELEKRWGSVECSQLCKLDLTKPEGLQKLLSSVKAEKCADFVKDAARALAKELRRIAAS